MLPGMIDVENENLLTPQQACGHRVFRDARGRKPHLSTLYRHMDAGVLAPDGSRVKLEFVRVPGGRRTSTEAISRFVQRLTLGAGSAPTVTPKFELRRQQRVDRELAAAGI